MARKICVITGSRADYGHLHPVMSAITADPDLTLQLIVCGQHLDARFGDTWKIIEADGFHADSKVDIGLTEDTALATAQATGRAVSEIALALAKLKPEIVVVLGDRFEIMAAGLACLILRIPVAHIHGGEVTTAAMDDAIRHALTKISALHFAATECYGARIRQMGEMPERVIVTGAPGLDHLEAMTFIPREQLAKDWELIYRAGSLW